ncbi:hypothetical protein SAMN05216489_06085 [Streptomyces sp. 3213]|uniref:hypothetical protein n=1 Tax=Streptomyces sp. 3213.3 TaxID=1855348 RepID=UPI00089BE35D|nr:hypothetical protein [Streptomyces sp. 3213.3]SEE28551.1 hypothetical protein SAMN05216489_06085 [Streptomyces sp. 3213] [Streptomyces sp. 3213.3]
MRMLRVLRASAAPVLRTPAVRAGFAVLPVVSLGLLCPVPSLVLALRRRTRAAWLAFAGFTAVLAAWITELALTPVDTHGALFGVDLLLVTLSMAGASAHAWRAWPRRAGELADGAVLADRAAGRADGLVADRTDDLAVDRAEGLVIDRAAGDSVVDLTGGPVAEQTGGPVVERAEEQR